MRKILVIIFFPAFFLAQEVEIKSLPGNINTNGAEINFFQKNDSIAYFTAINNESFKSSIYISSLVNNEWREKKYSEYNFDFLNTANINFLMNGRVFFSIYNKDRKGVEIAFYDKKNPLRYNKIPLFSQKEIINTQPHISTHNSQDVLYFVSNREGGFGGLDIWLSIIDKEGNFGVPLNAGEQINTPSDEITPFFNIHEGKMYFSSNKKGGVGGFDVYKTEGRFNLWNKPQNVKELNSKQDEMYLTFYNEKEGYFASNRKGAKFENSEYCCNDIFSFKYFYNKQDSKKTNQTTQIPLTLYFHNSEPNALTMKKNPQTTYKEAYVSYFKKKKEYQKYNPKLNEFFEKELQNNFNKLNMMFDKLLLSLAQGNKIKIKIKGYASPLDKAEYNQALSKRRISSVVNYLNQYKGGVFLKYINSKNLIITEFYFGESASSKKVSDNPKNKAKSIYSIEAIKERKVEIFELILEK